jgi:GAF domain-containing protein
MLLLLAADASSLVVSSTSQSTTGFQDQSDRQIHIPVGQGVAGHIAAEGKPVIFSDLATVEVINPLLREMGVRSLIGAPLISEERIIGVLHVATTRLHSFSQEDADLLQLVADRFATAVHRTRLYDAAHEAEQRKSAILEASLDCIILMDHQGVVTEFNPASERTFGYSRSEAVGQPLANLIIPPALREAHNRG